MLPLQPQDGNLVVAGRLTAYIGVSKILFMTSQWALSYVLEVGSQTPSSRFGDHDV